MFLWAAAAANKLVWPLVCWISITVLVLGFQRWMYSTASSKRLRGMLPTLFTRNQSCTSWLHSLYTLLRTWLSI